MRDRADAGRDLGVLVDLALVVGLCGLCDWADGVVVGLLGVGMVYRQEGAYGPNDGAGGVCECGGCVGVLERGAGGRVVTVLGDAGGGHGGAGRGGVGGQVVVVGCCGVSDGADEALRMPAASMRE